MRKKTHIFLIVVPLFLSTISCQKNPAYQLPTQLLFSAKPGDKETVKIRFKSVTDYFEQEEKVRQSGKGVTAELTSKVESVGDNKIFVVLNTTTRKDGTMSLYELGLPEKGETLKVTLNEQGYILDVASSLGGVPKNSIFYVPALVFPTEKVNVGSEWKASFKWRGADQLFLVETSAKFRFAEVIRNYKGNKVFKITVEASSQMTPRHPELQFSNQVTGYLLWDPVKKSIPYSRAESQDELYFPTQKVRSKVSSLYEAELL